METIRRLIGSPYRALTTFSVLAFLVGNADMLIAGLRADNDDQSGNGGFGVVIFTVLLSVIVRRFRRSVPNPSQEWASSRRFLASPIRLIVLASLGFFVVTSFGLFLIGVLDRNAAGVINGSIGATLLAFLLFQTAKALGMADADLASERERYPDGSPPRRPLWEYPLVVSRVVTDPGRAWFVMVTGGLMFVSILGTGFLVITRDPQLLLFPPTAVLMGLLLVVIVGKFAADDERAARERDREE